MIQSGRDVLADTTYLTILYMHGLHTTNLYLDKQDDRIKKNEAVTVVPLPCPSPQIDGPSYSKHIHHHTGTHP
jgi:hypothetical protein